MFGLNKRGVNEYAKIGLETGVIATNPVGLIVMLYDGALAACHQGLAHMQKKEIAEKGRKISKAIMIIENGLRTSLDKKAGGEIAENLDALYLYMVNRLYSAHLKNQAEHLQEVIKLLTDLRSAWAAIAKPSANIPEMNAAFNQSVSAGYDLAMAKG